MQQNELKQARSFIDQEAHAMLGITQRQYGYNTHMLTMDFCVPITKLQGPASNKALQGLNKT